MSKAAQFLALDLGAESGRGVVGSLDNGKLSLQEFHRFPNGPVILPDGMHWDILGIFRELKAAIGAASQSGADIQGIGIDTWGVDFGLLGKGDRLWARRASESLTRSPAADRAGRRRASPPRSTSRRRRRRPAEPLSPDGPKPVAAASESAGCRTAPGLVRGRGWLVSSSRKLLARPQGAGGGRRSGDRVRVRAAAAAARAATRVSGGCARGASTPAGLVALLARRLPRRD